MVNRPKLGFENIRLKGEQKLKFNLLRGLRRIRDDIRNWYRTRFIEDVSNYEVVDAVYFDVKEGKLSQTSVPGVEEPMILCSEGIDQ